VTKPRPPFDDWPIQAFDPRFGFAWYLEPAVFVSSATIERATIDAARIVQGWIDDVLRERGDEVRAAGGVFVFHDWRGVRGYDTEARKHYLDRMRARPKDYLRHSVTCVPANPLFRMAVETGNLVASMVARAKVELAHDPSTVIAKHSIGRPAPGSTFPGARRASSYPRS